MHLLGFITAFVHGNPLPWEGMEGVSWVVKALLWFFYLFAIVMYPVSAAMIGKNRRWGYWIVAAAPPVGGLFIFLGFFCPNSGLLMMLAGNFGREITWMAFIQIFSESMAVAYVIPLIYHKVWLLSRDGSTQ